MRPRRRVQVLALASLFAGVTSAGARAQFRSPITCDGCIGSIYYFDHGGVRDYACGNQTYGDHTGTDFSLVGYNQYIDDDYEVVAMADGVVAHTEDGYFDRCTRCGGASCGTGFGNGFANQVIINHGPHRTIYGHMKMGSIMVQPGDSVECGQVIGFIGSSGCSTGAHVHIEPSDAASFGGFGYTPYDAYAGECSPTPESLFVDQGDYRTLPGTACSDEQPTPACPPDTYEIWTCSEDLALRRRCVEGQVTDEPCEFGCTVMAPGTDDVCALPPDADGDGSRVDVDCDDGDGAVHPGAVDVCGDGVDQDCSGGDLECPPVQDDPPAPVGGEASGAAGGQAPGSNDASGPSADSGAPGGTPPTGTTTSPLAGQGGTAPAPATDPGATTADTVGPAATRQSVPDGSGCSVGRAAGSPTRPGPVLIACLAAFARRRRRARRAA